MIEDYKISNKILEVQHFHRADILKMWRVHSESMIKFWDRFENLVKRIYEDGDLIDSVLDEVFERINEWNVNEFWVNGYDMAYNMLAESIGFVLLLDDEYVDSVYDILRDLESNPSKPGILIGKFSDRYGCHKE